MKDFLKKNNLKPSPIAYKGTMCWKWVEQIVDLYENKDLTAKEVIEKLNIEITENSIIKICRTYGKKQTRSRGNRRAYVDENYFEEIDNWKKAYIVGFIFADGCITKSNNKLKLSFQINCKDIEILEFIKNEIKAENPINNIKKRNQIALDIHSEKICNDLKKYGIVERKSLTGVPKIENIPEKFQQDFIRGLIDGDGSVLQNGRVYICGNLYTITSVNDWFIKKGFETNVFQNKKSKVWYVYINKKNTSWKLFNLIWNNNKFSLKRKKERIYEYCKSIPC